jgi:ATP-binding cassette subfamily B protein
MTKIEFPRKPAAFLLYFLKSLTTWQKLGIAGALGMSALCVFTGFGLIYSFKLLIDAFPDANKSDIWIDLKYPFILIVVICVAHILSYRVRDMIDAYSRPYIQNNLRELLLRNLLLHSNDYFHNRFSGELINKIGNVTQAFSNIIWQRIQNGYIPSCAAIISTLLILGSIDINLAIIILVATIALIISALFLGRYLSAASGVVADCEGRISGQMIDTVTNISSVKNFSQQKHEMSLLDIHQKPFVFAYRKYVVWENIFWGAFNLLSAILVIGMIWYLIENWSKGKYSIGDISICVLILWDMWERFATLSFELAKFSGDLGKMSSALNDFVRPVSVEDKADAKIFAPKHGRIDFNQVSFQYDSGHIVFQDFSLTIPTAQKVGIVGLSGAGKTTLCQLLLRNYDIQSGQIVVGDFDIAAVTQESLRKNIAVIPQDPSLFHRTLHENILYGRPDATDDDVIAAARSAQAHDFILLTPDGYNTMVGERGVKLSGGQRQRIAIARAILKNAPILILDEATSALDSDTELQIQSALNRAMQGRTTLVIAHRLSTLSRLDRIIVMKDGRIIEDGNLNELIELGGHFSHLWALQAGGFLPEKIK